MGLTSSQITEINDLINTIKQGGTYEAFRTAVAKKNSELSLAGRNQEDDLWKEGIGKHVTEPGFIKYVLQPLGIQASLVEGFHEDMVVAGRPEDLKSEFSPFFTGLWGPTYTRTLDEQDIRPGGKYHDDFVLKLWAVRVPGLYYPFMGKPKKYEGQPLDVVCETTVGECRRLIKEHGLRIAPYLQREKEEHQSQNEKFRYAFDIRWFKMLWRYNPATGLWGESSWTENEMQKLPQELRREARDEDEDEVPTFVSTSPQRR